MSDKPNIPAPNSLVKYASATLVSTSGKPIKDKKKGRDAAPQSITNAQTEDILNSILPPREYTMEKQQLWIQCVSSTPAKREDVILLQENLDKKLQQRQARETGICPIREELYAQCFDELIRQITINCAERGLLLVRVRDEIRQTIQAYQTLYESSIAFGMRKALQAEQRKTDYNNKIKQLETECQDLTKQVEKIECTIEDMQKQDQELQEHEEAKHRDQVNFLKNANKVYKEELEKFLTGANVKK
ncbi:unnamed protein product [Paramecium sonneborni]|uniref:Uncharacterized protein n=1 Tax=Paramecium sonneborni TaxID=65129 RepID=A0A8S1KIF2_9CILI|nr:unnamed protein product [Paramecium sonneborni]